MQWLLEALRKVMMILKDYRSTIYKVKMEGYDSINKRKILFNASSITLILRKSKYDEHICFPEHLVKAG